MTDQNPNIDADPTHAIKPTNRPTSVQIDRIVMQEVTPTGVTAIPAVHFKLLTEVGTIEAFWPRDYALAVAQLLQQQATGLTIARGMP